MYFKRHFDSENGLLKKQSLKTPENKPGGGDVWVIIVGENQIKRQVIWKSCLLSEIELSCRVATPFCIVSHEHQSLFQLLMSSI